MTWGEIIQADNGEQVLSLLRAALITTAQKREAGTLTGGRSSAPDGYRAIVAANAEELSHEAYIAAINILAHTTDDTAAEVIAYRAANAVLCKQYREAKKHPDTMTISRDDEGNLDILDACALIGEYYNPSAAITAVDIESIAVQGVSHPRENANQRKKAVTVLLQGWNEKEAAREGGLTHNARKKLMAQVADYCMA